MSLLDNLENTDHSTAPVLAIYGTGGIGKTSLAAEFPNPLYLYTAGEKPPKNISMQQKLIRSTADLYSVVGALLTETHDFQTIIIDTLDALEPMIWADVCERKEWDSIDSNDKGSPTAFGKGWPEVDKDWQQFMEGMHELSKAGMIVVLLIHDDAKKVKNDPMLDEYRRYEPHLQPRAVDIIKNSVNALLFITRRTSTKQVEAAFGGKPTQKPEAMSGAERLIYTDERAGFLAKNRMDMPHSIPYKKGQGFSELSKYF